MAAATSGSPSALFDLKSAALTAMALVLKSTDLMALADALEARFGATPAMFDHDPVVIDLQAVRESTDPIDFDALAALLRRHRLQPVGVLGGTRSEVDSIMDIPVETGVPEAGHICDRLVAVPFRQIRERGFEARSHVEPGEFARSERARPIVLAASIGAAEAHLDLITLACRLDRELKRLDCAGDTGGRYRNRSHHQCGDESQHPRHCRSPSSKFGQSLPVARCGRSKMVG